MAGSRRQASEDGQVIARRQAEKQAARQRDEEALRAGLVSADELRARNGVIAHALRGARIDVSRIKSLG